MREQRVYLVATAGAVAAAAAPLVCLLVMGVGFTPATWPQVDPGVGTAETMRLSGPLGPAARAREDAKRTTPHGAAKHRGRSAGVLPAATVVAHPVPPAGAHPVAERQRAAKRRRTAAAVVVAPEASPAVVAVTAPSRTRPAGPRRSIDRQKVGRTRNVGKRVQRMLRREARRVRRAERWGKRQVRQAERRDKRQVRQAERRDKRRGRL